MTMDRGIRAPILRQVTGIRSPMPKASLCRPIVEHALDETSRTSGRYHFPHPSIENARNVPQQ